MLFLCFLGIHTHIQTHNINLAVTAATPGLPKKVVRIFAACATVEREKEREREIGRAADGGRKSSGNKPLNLGQEVSVDCKVKDSLLCLQVLRLLHMPRSRHTQIPFTYI